MPELIEVIPDSTALPAAGVPLETWAVIACDQHTSDPELKLTRQDGEWLMYRGAASAGSENRSMNRLLPVITEQDILPQYHGRYSVNQIFSLE